MKHDRHKWIIATKSGSISVATWTGPSATTQTTSGSQLEASLQALQTDYIDLYQFHSGVNSKFKTPGLWEVLDELMRAGKVRHLGISVSPNDNLLQVDRGDGRERRGHPSLSRQPARPQTRAEVAIEIAAGPGNVVAIDRAIAAGRSVSIRQRQDLGVVARVPLASGLLTGKYAPGRTFMQGDPRATQRRRDIEHQLREVRHIATTEVPKVLSMAQWALAWCLQHDAVTSVIPGCKDVHQVEVERRGSGVGADRPSAGSSTELTSRDPALAAGPKS